MMVKKVALLWGDTSQSSWAVPNPEQIYTPCFGAQEAGYLWKLLVTVDFRGDLRSRRKAMSSIFVVHFTWSLRFSHTHTQTKSLSLRVNVPWAHVGIVPWLGSVAEASEPGIHARMWRWAAAREILVEYSEASQESAGSLLLDWGALKAPGSLAVNSLVQVSFHVGTGIAGEIFTRTVPELQVFVV